MFFYNFPLILRGEAKENLNKLMKMIPYNDQRLFEGETKIHDGSKFIYWNPSKGPNSFNTIENEPIIIDSFRVDLNFKSSAFCLFGVIFIKTSIFG